MCKRTVLTILLSNPTSFYTTNLDAVRRSDLSRVPSPQHEHQMASEISE